ncbi:MAG: RNA pseudouridine synthase [Firmicutes bacterium]|nr:RNA pseudouridine synthase [Bacillota bacterium]
MNILYNDDSFIAVIKDFAIASQSEKNGDPSLCELLEKELSTTLYTVHRLDKPVGGIILYAKNKKAASYISGEIQNGNFIKEYTAVSCGSAKEYDKLCDTVIVNHRLNISKIVNKGTTGGKEAILEYKKISETQTSRYGTLSLLNVLLHTGRHHQIRVQLANASLPLWGDTKYNKAIQRKRRFERIGLFASKLEFLHPETKEKVSLSAPLPDLEPFDLFNYPIKI